MKNLGATPSNAADIPTKAYVDANANPGTDITALSVLVSTDIAATDLLLVLDVSDTTDGSQGTLKAISATEAADAMAYFSTPVMVMVRNRNILR